MWRFLFLIWFSGVAIFPEVQANFKRKEPDLHLTSEQAVEMLTLYNESWKVKLVNIEHHIVSIFSRIGDGEILEEIQKQVTTNILNSKLNILKQFLLKDIRLLKN